MSDQTSTILKQEINEQSSEDEGALEIVEPSTSQQDEQSCSNQVATCETTQSEDSTKNNHSKQADNFQCDVCKKYFNSQVQLTRHKNTQHSEKKPYACDLCRENFACKAGLTEHEKRLHSAQKTFVCKTCKKGFDCKRSLQLHMHTHLDISELPFKCDQCLKTFTTNSNFVCETCKKGFTRNYNLQRHMNTHTDQSKFPFKCRRCEKSFTRIDNLRDHSKRHTQTTAFTCGLCMKEFVQKRSRNNHIERQHLAKCQREFENEIVVTAFMVTYMARYKCNECSGAFDEMKGLAEHWFSTHADENKLLKCGICGREYVTTSRLMGHISKNKCFTTVNELNSK